MPDPATVERFVLAFVAMADAWLPPRMIASRLDLPVDQVVTILAALSANGDLDWNGVDLPDGWTGNQLEHRYHLPRREVSRGRRMEVVA